MRTVTVKTAKEYDILIGAGMLHNLGAELKKRIPLCKIALITDSTVGELYGTKAISSIEAEGFETCKFTFSAGENSKNIQTLSDILEFLAEQEMTRHDVVVALGGGVTGDMAGFAAAVYQRGMDFVQVPTTLLAAVDSSVGGKTAIDLEGGKNMAGAFHQPVLVLCDTDLLKSLPKTTFSDGVAEMLKAGVICEPELFARMANGNYMEDLEELIEICVSMKRDIVMRDEFDNGERQLLNLGHTLGHSIEKLSGFTISHGHAVAIGLHLIAQIAESRGVAEKGLAETIKAAWIANDLPYEVDMTTEAIAKGAYMDKKRKGKTISFVIPEKIGSCIIEKIEIDGIEEMIGKARIEV